MHGVAASRVPTHKCAKTRPTMYAKRRLVARWSGGLSKWRRRSERVTERNRDNEAPLVEALQVVVRRAIAGHEARVVPQQDRIAGRGHEHEAFATRVVHTTGELHISGIEQL